MKKLSHQLTLFPPSPMRPHTLPTKRSPRSKGLFRRLNAVTFGRKQRAVTADSAEELEHEEANTTNISRALTIIFLIHILAVILIFIHQRFLGNRPETSTPAPAIAAATPDELPQIPPGARTYVVQPGDNSASIAAKLGISEDELLAFNNHVELRPNLTLQIPPVRIVAQEPAEATALRHQQTSPEVLESTPQPLVAVAPQAVAAPASERPILVRPRQHPPRQSTPAAAAAAPSASSTTYTIQQNDNIYRIAKRFNVKESDLMSLNGISDVRKLKLGMKLKIPK